MKKIIQQIYYYIVCMRPKQWMKNVIIFIPLLFSGDINSILLVKKTVIIFFLFSVFVGATYVINDIKDKDKDKLHPKKKKRPIVAGKLNTVLALIVSIILMGVSLYFIYQWFNLYVVLAVLAYLVNTTIYTYVLKRFVIVDVFSIALGFVIRGLIGVFAISVILSPWLLIMLFFGALLLGFLKRYQEVMLGTASRKNIAHYNQEFLKQIIGMITTVILLAYTLYTFNSPQSEWMLATLPLVSFAVIRYYYNIFFLSKYEEGIEDIILHDKWIIVDAILYIGVVLIILFVK